VAATSSRPAGFGGQERSDPGSGTVDSLRSQS
jgi:hypothetical protein